ncbi:MAG TPA: hypothetical protein VIG99_03600 [Myxococcaceae bacterium]|jgi:hypothetical protein
MPPPVSSSSSSAAAAQQQAQAARQSAAAAQQKAQSAKPASPPAQAPKAAPSKAPASAPKDTFDAGRPAANNQAQRSSAKSIVPPQKEAPPPTKGEQQARDAVDVTTVGEERAALEKGGKDAAAKNAETADHVFSLAGKDQKDLPPGVEVVKDTDPNRAELVARNKDGEITAQTVAIRKGDETTIQKTTFDQGKASFTSTTTGANGDFSTTQASYKADPSKTPQAAPDVEALKNSRDPDVQVQQQSVRHDGDQLVASNYAQGKTGITETTKTYLQQSKDDATHSGDGIKDDFEDRFSDDKPVDVVNTRSVSIPAGGQKGEDGKQVVPQVSESATFSQGQMRLERDAGTKQYEAEDDGVPADFHPAASDLAKNPADLEGVKEGNDSSVQWKLEKSDGNTYDAQTFVEGQTDLSTSTHREAQGSTVTETVSGKVPSEEEGEDPVEISSNTEQTYAKDGSLAHLHKDAQDPDGTHTVTDFARTTKPGPEGLDINEHLNVQRTDKDGETYGIDRKTESRLSNEGVQLLSSDETVTGPDGTTGRTRLDETGTKTFINGAEVNGKDDLSKYPETAQHLVTQSGADTFKEAQGYINNGGLNAVKLLGIGSKIPTQPGATPTKLGDLNNELNQKLVDKFGQSNVDTAFRIQGGAVGGLTALGGLVGAVSSTNDLVDGIRDQDFGKIATGLAGEISNGSAIKNGGKAFLDAVKGLSPQTLSVEQKAVNTALRTAGWLDKVPGLSTEAATAGGAAAGTASKFLNKLGGPAAIAGVAISGYELYKAIDGGNGYQIAQASVGVAGASLVGAIAIGAAAGSIEPGLGTLIGAGVGLATFGVQQLIGLFDHSETDIADVKI